MKPQFFETSAHLVAWFEANHERVTEVWIGFHKVGSGRASITWPESVDAALCFGWIDGVRKSLDAARYMIRFTPRKPRSIWSAVNVRRVQELMLERRMHPAGIAAFERRADDRTAVYAYEQRKDAALEADEARRFQAKSAAWKWFSSQAPSYQRAALYWLVSAKKPETRARRLETLIADSGRGERIAPLRPRPGTR